jgi:hypothetical protein
MVLPRLTPTSTYVRNIGDASAKRAIRRATPLNSWHVFAMMVGLSATKTEGLCFLSMKFGWHWLCQCSVAWVALAPPVFSYFVHSC